MFATINPATNKTLQEYPSLTKEEILQKIDKASKAFDTWRYLPIEKRCALISKLGESLENRDRELGELISIEMGKPIDQSVAEIDKCAWLCQFYADHAADFLAPEPIETDSKKSYVRFDPLGLVMGIMPWNFPAWQVFRFSIPTLLAGNVTFLKPAPNVPGISLKIEELFLDALQIPDVFQTVFIEVDDIDSVIEHPFLQGMALTGSDRAGSAVASTAGKHIKKCVLELGGSDPFIVMKDADLSNAAEIAVKSRMNNTGQTCIAAKRLIVDQSVYEPFLDKVVEEVKSLKMGSPMDEETDLGAMAREDLLENLDRQVTETLQQGAKAIVMGGPNGEKGNFYSPCVLAGVKPGMPAYEEEIFGPVAILFSAENEEELIKLANDTKYGLGASIWSENREEAERIAAKIEAGAIAINDMVKSDPRMPFGGVKNSGFGRELGKEGIREFVNIKSVMVS